MKYLFSIMLVLAIGSLVHGQTNASGTVTSSEGEVLPGVNVIEKGTVNGVVTDFDGNYSISLTDPENAVLVFSYLGYQTQEIPVSGQSTINVTLAPSSTELDEVVIIGYGEQSKARVTGAISSVKAEEFENRPVSSFDNSLQGKAAGVQVIQNTGAPGGGATVRIRGIASISGGNEPLYVIDGVPIKSGNFAASNQLGSVGLNALADINPNDIASIEVLKDASAASIYGSRASNGVVLITTKRGSAGKPTLNIGSYYGVQRIIDFLPTVNGQQFREIFFEGWLNAGRQMRPEIADILNPTTGGNNNTNWQDLIFEDAPIQNVDLSLSGGTEKLRFAISANYFNQEGILLDTGFKRVTSRLNVDYQAYENIKLGASVSYSNGFNNLAVQSPANNNPIQVWMNTPSYQTQFPIEGEPTWIRNPVSLLEDPFFESKTDRIIGNIFGEVDIIEGLKFRSNLGIDLLSLKEDLFVPSTVRNIGSFRLATARDFQDLGWINENTLNYKKLFGDKHSLDVLLGFSQQVNKINTIFVQGSQAPSDKIPTVNASAVIEDASSTETSWGLVSYFGRINYGFMNKYLLTGTVRTDGSSRFGEDSRYGTFPSGSFAWRVSEESFMQNSSIDELKLRVSYGSTGNQEGIGNFVSQGLFSSDPTYLGIGGFAPAANGIPNRLLSWERTNQFNVGADIALFNNRVSLTAEYFVKKTEDLLFNVQLPGTSGFETLTTNLGSVENKGVDFNLVTQNFDGAFKWSTNINISFIENEITELPNGEDFFIFGNSGNGLAILREGEPLGSFFGWQFDGVYATTEDVPAGPNGQGRLRSGGENGPEFEGGDAIFRDLDNNGIIDEDDRTIIGQALPDFTGGITNNFSYKGFDLSVFFNFSYGNDIYNAPAQYRNGWNGLYVQPDLDTYNNRWQEPGDITDVPRNVFRGAQENGRANTSRWIEDGSFLRLKTITLSYNFQPAILDRLGIRSLRAYLTGQNLWTLTDYSGYDPEAVSSSANNAGIFGVDEFLFPLSKSVIFGVNLGL